MNMKEFAIANLGKNIKWKDGARYPLQEGMIVGYNELQKAIIVSFMYDIGWGKENIAGEDVVILHSPLNVSFWYIYPNLNKRWEVIQ